MGCGWGLGPPGRISRIDYSFRFVQESEAAHSLGLSLHFDAPEKSLPPALQALVDRGNRQLKMNQYPEAVLTFEEALILSPSCPPAWEGLELARQRMGGR
jgi:tetratricopeptide (TPR) repeat protein